MAASLEFLGRNVQLDLVRFGVDGDGIAFVHERNRAAHGESVDAPTALWLLKEAFDLGSWLFLSYGGGAKSARRVTEASF